MKPRLWLEELQRSRDGSYFTAIMDEEEVENCALVFSLWLLACLQTCTMSVLIWAAPFIYFRLLGLFWS